jgi:hypothetical protein
MKRRSDRRRNQTQTPPAPTTPQLPPGLYQDVKAVALRMVLTALSADDEAARQAEIRNQLIDLASASPGLLIGVVGYLLSHVADGLERGYGGKAGAIGEVTKELAAAILADSAGQP